MSEIMDDPTEQPAAEPTPMKSLSEHVRKIVAEAPAAVPMAKVKSLLKAAGVKLGGKTGVSDADIQRELESEGVHSHPAPKPDGKPKFWHSKHVTAEEKAAAKVAGVERKKADKVAAVEAKKAEAAAGKADAARHKIEMAAADAMKKMEAVAETVRKKVETLGDEPVAVTKLGKPPAKLGEAGVAAFEAALQGLVDEKKLYPYPGGKYGRKEPPLWHEHAKVRKPLEAIVKAWRSVVGAAGVAHDEVFSFINDKLGRGEEKKGNEEPTKDSEKEADTPAPHADRPHHEG